MGLVHLCSVIYWLMISEKFVTNYQAQINSWSMDAQLPVQFDIKQATNIFSPENHTLLEFGTQGLGARRMVIIDRKICDLYLDDVSNYFKMRNVECHLFAIDASEEDKNLDNLVALLREIENFSPLRRDEPLIAVGGGVLLDLVGLAASVYRRGIPYSRVPTTLVGLIDASVGIKTGINFEVRRNRLGTYFPPLASYLDKRFLQTLDKVELVSGLGEILKMAVIKDEKLFILLQDNGRHLVDSNFQGPTEAIVDEVIGRSALGMIEELKKNLWERDLRRLVDFGHSFSPIIEMRSLEGSPELRLTHGQAVAIDVIFSSIISHLRGLLDQSEFMKIYKTAQLIGLPTIHPLFLNPLIVQEALNDTMKHRNGNQNLPIPIKIGAGDFINDLSHAEIKAAIIFLQKINIQYPS